MTARLMVSWLLLGAGAIAQAPPANQRGSIEAQLISLGRSEHREPILTAAVKLTNSSPNYIFVLLFGAPRAVDNAGAVFTSWGSPPVSGVAFCLGREGPGQPVPRSCVTRVFGNEQSFLFPADQYTEIEPGQSANFTVVLRAGGGGSTGDTITLTQQIAYRVVKPAEIDADQSLAEDKKLKALHFGSLNLSGSAGAKEFVTSRISYDMK